MRQCLVVIAAIVASRLATAQVENSKIHPGVPWMDTSGNRVYAGGGNLYFEDGLYYLVGEGNKLHEDCSECFNQYSSPDLVTWSECRANVGKSVNMATQCRLTRLVVRSSERRVRVVRP